MKFRDLSGALRILVGAFVGITLYANFGPQPEPTYRNVEVPVERIVEVERIDTLVQWRERIVYKHIPATQVATAPDAGQPDVDSFCADAVTRALAGAQPDTLTRLQEGRDTRPGASATLLLRSVRHAIASVQQDSTNATQPITQQLLLRSVRVTDPWFFGKPDLILTGPTSAGDLRQLTYGVRDGFEARTHADTVIVRYPRSALVKQGVEYGIVMLVGAFVGQLVF